MSWQSAKPVKTNGQLDITNLDSRMSLRSAFIKLIGHEVLTGVRQSDNSSTKARQIMCYCETYDEMLDQIVQYVDVVGTRPQLDLRETCSGLGG
jgi:class 3 adenylate cyclase